MYSLHLLWQLKNHNERLGPSGRRNFYAAAAVDVLVLAAIAAVLALKVSL